jgi:hypothetical protein
MPVRSIATYNINTEYNVKCYAEYISGRHILVTLPFAKGADISL